MKNPILVSPSPQYLESYLAACKEFKESQVSYFHLHNPETFSEWKHTIYENFESQKLGIGLKLNYVPASTFWLVEDGEYIGTGNIRHRLTEDLRKIGGHIGFAIRVSKWRQGYGTVQLSLLLKEAAELGINPVLITCDKANIASAKTIEKNGGKRQDIVYINEGENQQAICRYWIDTAESLA